MGRGEADKLLMGRGAPRSTAADPAREAAKARREAGPPFPHEGRHPERGNTDGKWWTLKDDANGVLHREDGPAIEMADGTREWWVKGLRHRADGPAYIWADGSEEYWMAGE